MSNHTTETDQASIVAHIFERFSAGDFEGVLAHLTDDATLSLPFQDTSGGLIGEVHGEGLRPFFGFIPRMFDQHRLVLDDVMNVTGRTVIVARYHGDFLVRRTGRPYANTYIAVFEFRGDKVSSWTEYFNPDVLAESLRVTDDV